MRSKLGYVAAGGLISTVAFLTLGTFLSGFGWVNASYVWDGATTCGTATGEPQQVKLPFVSGDRLSINLPSSVEYRPGEKAEITIKGDAGLIKHVRVDSGRIDMDCSGGHAMPKLDIIVSGPAIAQWDLLGSGSLTFTQVKQSNLAINIKGSGTVSGSGAVDDLTVSISGSGDAHLNGLTAQTAKVQIRGSGNAEVTATKDADVSIFGSGNVELFGHPTVRSTEIRGSGRILQSR